MSQLFRAKFILDGVHFDHIALYEHWYLYIIGFQIFAIAQKIASVAMALIYLIMKFHLLIHKKQIKVRIQKLKE